MTFEEAKRTLYFREHSAAIDALSYPGNEYLEGVFDGIHEAAKIFTLVDKPEIIRCKDCKHYVFADNRAFGFPTERCELTGFEDVDDDDYCSRAERRSDDVRIL